MRIFAGYKSIRFPRPIVNFDEAAYGVFTNSDTVLSYEEAIAANFDTHDYCDFLVTHLGKIAGVVDSDVLALRAAPVGAPRFFRYASILLRNSRNKKTGR